MIKCQRWKILLLVFQICVSSVKTYYFQCPSQAAWKLRAQGKCNSNWKYFCLYNNIKEEYVEGCNGPDWDRKGSKRIYAGHFSRDKCSNHRFQPFLFFTNRSMSDCIYAKSICSEEGQIVYNDNSTKDDRSCRCDYTKYYSFVKTPRNVCFCIPTEENCSCYIKPCPVNMKLSADYSCTKSDIEEKPKCKDIAEYNKTLNDKIGIIMVANHSWSNKMTIKHQRKDLATITLCFVGIVITGGCIFAVLFQKWTSEKCNQRKQKENLSVKRNDTPKEFPSYQKKRELTNITSEENNFLLVVHGFKKIVYPVIKNHFNTQCPGDILQQIRMNTFEDKTAQHNSCSTKLETGRRKNGIFFTEIQKRLLFSPNSMTKEEWKNEDLKMMIYILKRITKNEENGEYVDQLEIINNIRREIVHNKSGVLDRTSFIDIMENLQKAVLYFGEECYEQKLLKLLHIQNVTE